MTESIKLIEIFTTTPEEIYNAWLDSTKHSNMTGGQAECSITIGDQFTAWDGYISGKNIHLILNEEIIQTWRTSEFDSKDEDSKLVIKLKEVKEGTELTLLHSNIPKGQTQYKEGWEEHYFTPMKNYFNH